MLHFSVNEIEGKVINEGTIHQRRIKLIASPVSPAKRMEYGCGMAIIPVGHVHEEHAHADSEELIYVVSGIGVGMVSGRRVKIKAGDVVALDKGEAHQFSNAGKEDLKLYWVYSPSGPETRFL